MRTVKQYTYRGWDVTVTYRQDLEPFPFEALIEKGDRQYDDPTSYQTEASAARQAELNIDRMEAPKCEP